MIYIELHQSNAKRDIGNTFQNIDINTHTTTKTSNHMLLDKSIIIKIKCVV